MAYDEDLADRIRALLADEFDVVEKAMFGGLAFLVRDHLTVAAGTDPAVEAATLAQAHVEPMSPGPHPMPGWVRVDNEGLADDADLRRWVEIALDFVDTLPPK